MPHLTGEGECQLQWGLNGCRETESRGAEPCDSLPLAAVSTGSEAAVCTISVRHCRDGCAVFFPCVSLMIKAGVAQRCCACNEVSVLLQSNEGCCRAHNLGGPVCGGAGVLDAKLKLKAAGERVKNSNKQRSVCLPSLLYVDQVYSTRHDQAMLTWAMNDEVRVRIRKERWFLCFLHARALLSRTVRKSLDSGATSVCANFGAVMSRGSMEPELVYQMAIGRVLG